MTFTLSDFPLPWLCFCWTSQNSLSYLLPNSAAQLFTIPWACLLAPASLLLQLLSPPPTLCQLQCIWLWLTEYPTKNSLNHKKLKLVCSASQQWHKGHFHFFTPFASCWLLSSGVSTLRVAKYLPQLQTSELTQQHPKTFGRGLFQKLLPSPEFLSNFYWPKSSQTSQE